MTTLTPAKSGARRAWLLAASLGLFAYVSPLFASVVVALGAADWGLARATKNGGRWSRLLSAILVAALNLAALAALWRLHLWTDWLGAHAKLAGAVVGEGGSVRAVPIGVSLLFAQNAAHALDVGRGRVPSIIRLSDHLLFSAFFPRVAAGPMMTAEAFVAQIEDPVPMDRVRFGRAVGRLSAGSLKLVVFADYLALNMVDKVFDLPTLFSTTETLFALYGNAVVLYLTLSGWSDIAVCVGALLGFDLPENFRSPMAAIGPRSFWRRWMAPLTDALRVHVFRPLAGERNRWRGAVAAFAPPLLVAALVGATPVLWAWAGFAGGGVALSMMLLGRRTRGMNSRVARALGVLATLHGAVALWALFRAHDFQSITDLMSILPLGIWETPNLTLVVMAAFGAALAGSLAPAAWWSAALDRFSRAPVVVQLVAVAAVGWILWKAGAASEVPFVYERM